MQRYAIAITEDNIKGVILSEAGLNYNVNTALRWLKDYGDGWFVRDPSSPFDCLFLTDEVFHQIYLFTNNDQHCVMRHIDEI